MLIGMCCSARYVSRLRKFSEAISDVQRYGIYIYLLNVYFSSSLVYFIICDMLQKYESNLYTKFDLFCVKSKKKSHTFFCKILLRRFSVNKISVQFLISIISA